ncbi:MAG: WYL domain-containing protein [Desulfobacteraceae bacterium]|nr:WYL domain-containing protein [Desulfobacteraceae bacterium]
MKTKFDRMLRILRLLEQESLCSTGRLAEELGVSERSVFRYMNSLQQAFFPIVYDRERKTYAFSDGFHLKKSRLNADEMLALSVARRLLGSLGGIFDVAFESLENKIMDATIPRADLKPFSTLAIPVQADKNGSDLTDLMKDLALACIEQRYVSISYVSLYTEELTKRDIEPYYLFFSSDGFWTLRAFCRLRNGWRTFALDRIRKWKLLDKYFIPRLLVNEIGREVSRGFDSYLDGDPVDVVIQFSPEIRPYVERKIWHSSQRKTEAPDGWLQLEFTTTGLEGMKQWLYRWMPHIRVVAPESLRKTMMEDLDEQRELLRRGGNGKERGK